MEKRFLIELDMKNACGFFPYAQFYMNMNIKDAMKLFSDLEGLPISNESEMNGPIKLRLVYYETNYSEVVAECICTLGELERNCGLITKKIFKNLLNDVTLKKKEKF